MSKFIYEKSFPSYVYILTHKQTNEIYIGARFANKIISVDDLGVYYFTSSTNVKNRFDEFNYYILYESFDNKFVYMVEQYAIYIATLSNSKLLNKYYHDINNSNIFKWIPLIDQEYRTRCSSRTTGKNNPMFGKQQSSSAKEKISNANKGKIPWNKGKTNIYTEETKKKMGESNIGKKPSTETIEKYKIRSAGENNPMFGKHHTDETKRKIGHANSGEKSGCYGRIGKKHPMYGKTGELNPYYGKTHSPEVRLKISESHKNAPKLTCPHCGKTGSQGNMKRWHFDNCKFKKQGIE